MSITHELIFAQFTCRISFDGHGIGNIKLIRVIRYALDKYRYDQFNLLPSVNTENVKI